ncbi:hypothetical protein EPI10_016467 [Gossypium australe]|uniref:Uncharacterized protein n=1 Tax=Gossypium australe TaxID=47621 RepID=A0A5B6VNY8_9ROSI|nr:hypothetical protein EPI10_016467 [Gossypium australe]
MLRRSTGPKELEPSSLEKGTKKNNIDKLKDSKGTWHEDSQMICNVAWSYFNGLFKCSLDPNDECD